MSGLKDRGIFAVTGISLLVLLGWDASALDIVLARWAGGPHGFALRDTWLLDAVMHQGAKALSWLVVLGLSLAVVWPVGPLRRLEMMRRVEITVLALAAALAVALLKSASYTSCPWDLQEFGGIARHVSHWMLTPDGGPGRCFPAGHASHGFCFFGLWLVLREGQPRVAALALTLTLLAGFALGLAQQLRGAHFMSHTLWTAWICWVVSWIGHGLWERFVMRRPGAHPVA